MQKILKVPLFFRFSNFTYNNLPLVSFKNLTKTHKTLLSAFELRFAFGNRFAQIVRCTIKATDTSALPITTSCVGDPK